jgi:LysR family transcriptional regulator (chromosome initiation inhibitor)
MMFDLGQLEALDAAVAEGTLEAAAARLHVTPSAVSQRLRALERATGQVLRVRTKPVRVTDSGAAVLRLARQVGLLAADTLAELGAGAGAGPAALPVAINADSMGTWVLASLPAGTPIHVYREDEARTRALLRDGTVVAAVTTDPEPVAGCRSVPLGAMRYRPMATPAFAKAHPDLATAPMVTFDANDHLQHRHLRAVGIDAQPPAHRFPASADFVAAIRLGLGWGMVADLQRAPDDGLVELQPSTVIDVPLHLQHWRLRSPSLDRLVGAIEAGAARLSASSATASP